jgi:hypothetical protein
MHSHDAALLASLFTKTKRAVISIDLPVLSTSSRHYAYLILVTAAHFPQSAQPWIPNQLGRQ